MAKKKDFGISPEMLQALSIQSEEENRTIRQRKEKRENQDEIDQNSYYEEREVRNKINNLKKFDRKRERPIQKTVHLTIEVDNKVNMIKSVLKTLGKKTTFEDLLFDLLETWLNENYDAILSGKLIYPGNK